MTVDVYVEVTDQNGHATGQFDLQHVPYNMPIPLSTQVASIRGTDDKTPTTPNYTQVQTINSGGYQYKVMGMPSGNCEFVVIMDMSV